METLPFVARRLTWENAGRKLVKLAQQRAATPHTIGADQSISLRTCTQRGALREHDLALSITCRSGVPACFRL